MNISEELHKLAALRQSGALTEEEFRIAKKRLLSEQTLHSTERSNEDLRHAVKRFETRQLIGAAIFLILTLVLFFAVILLSFSSATIQPYGKP